MPDYPSTFEGWKQLGFQRGYLQRKGRYLEYVHTKPQPKQQIEDDPEELVRAAFYVELIERYQYPKERLNIEIIVPRRTPSDLADIVVFEDDEQKKPYIVVEAKKDDVTDAEIKQAVEQTFGNANSLRAKYAAVVAGTVRIAFDVAGFDPREREKNVIADLPERYHKPVKYRFWKGMEDREDLRPATLEILRTKFQQCHDILWQGGRRNPAEAFDEMSKLLFCKMQDERFYTRRGHSYHFQVGTYEASAVVAKRVRDIYEAAQKRAPNVFKTGLLEDDDLIYSVVEKLQEINLNRSDLDAKGRAFEKFLDVVFKGSMGQYFTPRPIVKFAIEMLSPCDRDTLIDPACGSGGFLLYALEKIRDDSIANLDPNDAEALWKDWALRCLHGMEINHQITRVAMMGMILHDDGHTNIRCVDALESYGVINSIPDTITIAPGSFTLIMTNPPFGNTVKRVRHKAEHPYLDLYTLGGKDRDSQTSQVLFIERCLDLLQAGGRLGIVLPDGVLNNPSSQHQVVREFVEDRARLLAIVSLPQATFASAGPSVKSSLVFLQKFTDDERTEYEAAWSQARTELWPEFNALRVEAQQNYDPRIESYDRADLRAEIDLIATLEADSKEAREARQRFRALITAEDRERAQALRRERDRELKEIGEREITAQRRRVKELFDYPIFFAAPARVGITSAGEEDTNELPQVAEQHKLFLRWRNGNVERGQRPTLDQPHCFTRWWSESDRWDAKTARQREWRDADKLCRLSDLLEPRYEVVSEGSLTVNNVTPITIHFDGSIVPRDLKGKKHFKGKLFAVHAGDLVFSKIDLRNGAIGLLPPTIQNAVVTSEYPVYRIREERVLPSYLALLLRTTYFRELINSMVSGTSGRKRIYAADFVNMEIPLPSLPHQRELVAAHERAQAALVEATALLREAQVAFEVALTYTAEGS